MDKRRFRRLFPKLADEMEKGDTLAISGIQEDRGEPEPQPGLFRGYTPTALDYLRRANNEMEAESTINSLEERNEISTDYAEHLRKQLREKGLQSFGPRKEDEYYLKKGGY